MKTFTTNTNDIIAEAGILQVEVNSLHDLCEATELPKDGDTHRRLLQLNKMMDAAWVGMDKAGKITDEATRMKHESQIMSNMRKIKKEIMKLKGDMEQHWKSWHRKS